MRKCNKIDESLTLAILIYNKNECKMNEKYYLKAR
jgi:hypothetical protein